MPAKTASKDTKKTAKKATRSGNPAKRAEAQATLATASSIKDFKKRRQATPLTLPSGLVVEARRTSLETIVRSGNVPNSLLPLVEKALNKGSSIDVEELVGDEVDMDKVADMMNMVDELVVASVANPQVHSIPEDEDDRDDELLYVDEMDEEDKLFIFQWVIGGTSDLEQFRGELVTTLESVAKK